MSPVGPSSSSASQVYSGVQRSDNSDTNRNAVKAQANRTSQQDSSSSFKLPNNATPKGDWVLSENANPQNFEANAPRGSYLNVVV